MRYISVSIDTITFSLKGIVPLKEFSDAVKHFSELINSLSGEIGGETEIEWEVVRSLRSSWTRHH